MSKANLSYKGYVGSSEISFEDECLHGKIQFIDDLITYEGNTPTELLSAFKNAVDRYLDYCKKSGKPANKPYSGSFNVRTGCELHRDAAMFAFTNGMGLNELVVKSIKDAIYHGGRAKVEHIHQYHVTVNTNSASTSPVSGTVSASMHAPQLWGEISATTH